MENLKILGDTTFAENDATTRVIHIGNGAVPAESTVLCIVRETLYDNGSSFTLANLVVDDQEYAAGYGTALSQNGSYSNIPDDFFSILEDVRQLTGIWVPTKLTAETSMLPYVVSWDADEFEVVCKSLKAENNADDNKVFIHIEENTFVPGGGSFGIKGPNGELAVDFLHSLAINSEDSHDKHGKELVRRRLARRKLFEAMEDTNDILFGREPRDRATEDWVDNGSRYQATISSGDCEFRIGYNDDAISIVDANDEPAARYLFEAVIAALPNTMNYTGKGDEILENPKIMVATDGMMIYCRTAELADAMADLIEDLGITDCACTGEYDKSSDDNLGGWFYVDL